MSDKSVFNSIEKITVSSQFSDAYSNKSYKRLALAFSDEYILVGGRSSSSLRLFQQQQIEKDSKRSTYTCIST